MRTVRAILEHAAKIRNERNELAEDEIIYRIVSTLHEPMFTVAQVAIFRVKNQFQKKYLDIILKMLYYRIKIIIIFRLFVAYFI